MRYDDFVSEYLVAGLIVTVSLALAIADLAGVLQHLPNGNRSPGAADFFSLGSLPGALALLMLVAVSYPTGYVVFRFSFWFLQLVGGRERIYDTETRHLARRPYCDLLRSLERDSPKGYARGDPYERAFSLIRLFLHVHHHSLFQALNAYWTRLSRMFAVFSLAFALSALLFILVGLLKSTRGFVPTTFYLWLGCFSTVMAALCVLAYRRALRREIELFVGVAQSLWTSHALPSSKTAAPAYVFAYGSNMLTARLRQRVPSAMKLCSAEISGYRLVFNKRGADGSGKANLVHTKSPDDRVFGVLFQIDRAELAALDLAEPNYDRVRVQIMPHAGPGVDADVYAARPEAIDEALRPFDWYLELVIRGAEEHGLPHDYCSGLRAQVHVPDPDPDRRMALQELLEE